AWDDDGFLQYDLQTKVGRFLVLDTLIPGDAGRLGEKRLGWLRGRLEAAKETQQDVFIFMHHVPFDIGMPWLDRIKMENGDDLWSVLADFDRVRHLFFGHVHRPVHGSWHGIPFSAVRATTHQVVLRFNDVDPQFIEESPAYSVVLVGSDQVVIHDHNFLDEQLPLVS
ncbi:MAG: phosphodiesterase, partial [Paracoccaceae bacterium]